MNLLLDTHALLWWKAGSRKLGSAARRAIEREAADVRVSAVSAWEIAIKSRLGRIRLDAPLHTWMPAGLETEGFTMMSITVRHALGVASLPDHHDDPFDRLLIVQAQDEGLTIVTADAVFHEYDVRLLDARR